MLMKNRSKYMIFYERPLNHYLLSPSGTSLIIRTTVIRVLMLEKFVLIRIIFGKISIGMLYIVKKDQYWCMGRVKKLD